MEPEVPATDLVAVDGAVEAEPAAPCRAHPVRRQERRQTKGRRKVTQL